MTTALLVPLDGGGRFGPPWAGGDPSTTLGGIPPFAPFLGGLMFFLFLLLTAATLFFLFRTGRVGPPPWAGAGNRAPEAEAKKVLAERFARGDIGTDEFMEKASVLNWTPGSDPYADGRPRKKR